MLLWFTLEIIKKPLTFDHCFHLSLLFCSQIQAAKFQWNTIVKSQSYQTEPNNSETRILTDKIISIQQNETSVRTKKFVNVFARQVWREFVGTRAAYPHIFPPFVHVRSERSLRNQFFSAQKHAYLSIKETHKYISIKHDLLFS